MDLAASPPLSDLRFVVEHQVGPLAAGELERRVAEDAGVALELLDDLGVGLVEHSSRQLRAHLTEESDDAQIPLGRQHGGLAHDHPALEAVGAPGDPLIGNDLLPTTLGGRLEAAQVLQHVGEDGDVALVERRGREWTTRRPLARRQVKYALFRLSHTRQCRHWWTLA